MNPTDNQPQNGAQAPVATKPRNQILTVPVAILLGTILIAGAILLQGYFNNKRQEQIAVGTGTGTGEQQVEITPVTDKDHIRGNPDAKVFVVEYSDMECPFCKQFHSTLKQVFQDYGPKGEVAWVYRHFPLYKGSATQPPLHANAGKFAEGAECAAEIGGNDAFWKYLDNIFDATPSTGKLDPLKLPAIATASGVDANKFSDCLASGKYAQKISDEYEAALKAGARGTPYTILLRKDTNEPLIIDRGALPYDQMKGIIEAFLNK